MAFKPSGRKRIGLHLEETQPLRMTSLIDLFTNILIFLLMSYSPLEINIAPSQNLTLPNSISTKMPIEAVTIAVAKDVIVVEGRPVAKVEPNFEITGLDPSALRIDNLYSELKRKRDILVRRAEQYKREPPEKVLIQADKEVPFKLLLKVLKTAGEAGFSQILFLTYQREEMS